jgi:hypothetical protein
MRDLKFDFYLSEQKIKNETIIRKESKKRENKKETKRNERERERGRNLFIKQ